MNRLQAELRRLYRASSAKGDDANLEESGLIGPDGGVRAMVLELARPADWSALSALWQGVQADLELPAPAIAVSGIDGFQLWFSLVEPVPAAQANSFLESLRLRYLGHVAPKRIDMKPSLGALPQEPIQHANVVPALRKDTGQWSAFIAPDLAAVFSDEPWLDVCPSPDAQAEVLSRLKSTKPADFQVALDRLKIAAQTATPQTAPPTLRASSASILLDTGAAHARGSQDPKRFLLDVMGDPALEMHLRIEAARALLPYFEIQRSA